MFSSIATFSLCYDPSFEVGSKVAQGVRKSRSLTDSVEQTNDQQCSDVFQYLGRMDVEDCCPMQKANDWVGITICLVPY